MTAAQSRTTTATSVPTKKPRQLSPRQRALALLRLLLTPTEFAEVRTTGYLTVQSRAHRDVTYRVPRDPGFVGRYEGGRLVEHLCVQSTAEVPWDDLVIMHKLLIESDEEAYLEAANHFGVRPTAGSGRADLHEDVAQRLRRLLEGFEVPPPNVC